MGLLEQEIKELRQLNHRVMKNQVSQEEIQARIAIYSQTEKRAKMILQAMAMGAKYGKTTLNRIANSNVIGDGSYVDLDIDFETDKVNCIEQHKVITRAECLDYSGESEHTEDCTSCKHFKITRDMLVPA